MLITITHSGEGNGSALQYSCLKNSVDRELWHVHGVTESDMAEQLTLSLAKHISHPLPL